MRLYVAGPITGRLKAGVPILDIIAEFKEAARQLEKIGFDAVLPYDIDGWVGASTDEATWREYMRKDFPIVCTCAGIVLLPGWTSSRGSPIESFIMQTIGGKLYEYIAPEVDAGGKQMTTCGIQELPYQFSLEYADKRKKQMLGQNPKDLLGIRKPRISTVPPSSIIYTALGMQDGAIKYGPYNWRDNAVIASIYADATGRHMLAWFDGEDIDPKSGVPHLGHASACIAILVDAFETGNLIDDRPKAGKAADIIRRFTKA